MQCFTTGPAFVDSRKNRPLGLVSGFLSDKVLIQIDPLQCNQDF